jgi:hypothetical protein
MLSMKLKKKFLRYIRGEKEEIVKGELQVLATFFKDKNKKDNRRKSYERKN